MKYGVLYCYVPETEDVREGIISVLVLCIQIDTIGFVLTAKSLACYKQLKNREFAEKYLIGTLSSTAIAIVVTLLLK